MCISPKVPDAGAQARSDEMARQGRINEGMGRIDENFKQFNDDFYKGRSNAYLDYYNPQMSEQYNDALRKLTLNLGGSGIASSAGIRKIGDLETERQRQGAAIAGQATDFANQTRGQVEQNRSELVSQLNASADPSAAASAAIKRASVIGAAPSFSPLGNLFSQFTQAGQNAIYAEATGRRGAGTGLFSNNGGRSPSGVVSYIT